MDENGARFRNNRNVSFDTIEAINNYRNVRVAVLFLLLFRNGNTRDKTERCQGNRINSAQDGREREHRRVHVYSGIEYRVMYLILLDMLPFFFICFAEEEEEEHRRKIWWLLRDLYS
jgi:hypothetical protein